MVKAYPVGELENVKKEVSYSAIVNCPHCKKKFAVFLEPEDSCNKTVTKEKE